MPTTVKRPEKQIHQYSFCATRVAGDSYHIRRLTAVGRKYLHGADTPALCGAPVVYDTAFEVNESSIRQACTKCAKMYRKKLWAAGGMC